MECRLQYKRWNKLPIPNSLFGSDVVCISSKERDADASGSDILSQGPHEHQQIR
jgi:hypothetical protein